MFPTGATEGTFRAVRGQERHRLLRDPGAASGIVGTDSLLTCYNDALEPLGVGCDLVPTTA
eukprot:8369755-Pyramimonas_sp.AAC.1